MLKVTDTAKTELEKVLASEMAKDKWLVLFYQGAGWSGPVLGMTLVESTDGLVRLESNGLSAYIEPGLNDHLERLGDINIDFITNAMGSGYTIVVGEKADCASKGCSC